MGTEAAPGAVREASIERALGGAFSVLAARPFAAFGIALLLSAAPSEAVLFEYFRLAGGDYGPLGRSGSYVVLAFAALLVLAVSTVAQGALVRLAASHREARRASLGEALESGCRALLPMVARTVLATVATVVAAVAFLVPAMLLYVVWAVSVPALILERLGPTAALERSQVLTRGARWRVFGFQLVILLGAWMLNLAQNALRAPDESLVGALTVLGVGAAVGSAITAFSAVAHTLLYCELRDWKEGPPVERLAEVFR